MQFLDRCRIFWNREISEELTAAWWEQIERFTVTALSRAFQEYLETEEYFPVPGRLIPLIKKQINCYEAK